MSAPCQVACSPWIEATDPVIPTKCSEDATPEELEQAIADATDTLYLMSGQLWPGWCRDTVRPCGRSIYSMPRSVPSLGIGQTSDRTWNGICSCNHSIDQCGCSSLSEVTLGVYPIAVINEVKLDGEVLDATEYRVDEFQYLVRTTEGEGWPCCQNLKLDSDQEGTFEVTVTYGSTPRGAYKGAVAMLACQLLRGRNGEDCNLPPNVTSLTRQGITLNVQAVVSLLQQGQTGIYEVDLWLRSVNPTNQQRPAGILVPGSKSSVRRTDT